MNKTYKFNQIFKFNKKEIPLTTNREIEVNDMRIPNGVVINEGVRFGGIDFTKYIGCDIAGYEQEERVLIIGVYAGEKQKEPK